MSELQSVSGNRFRGFYPIYQKELAFWFRSYRWITQIILWLSLTTIPAIWMTPNMVGDRGISYLTVFVWLSSSLMSIGVIILAQNSIISEKLSQTLLWVYSKPLSSIGFICAKFAAFAVVIGTLALGIPALCTLGAALFVGQAPIANFGIAIALVYLIVLFFLALTLMLGTLFEKIGIVSAIAIFTFFFATSLPVDRNLRRIEPYSVWALARYAATSLTGQFPSTAWIAIGVTITLIILCLAIAVWRMEQSEL